MMALPGMPGGPPAPFPGMVPGMGKPIAKTPHDEYVLKHFDVMQEYFEISQKWNLEQQRKKEAAAAAAQKAAGAKNAESE